MYVGLQLKCMRVLIFTRPSWNKLRFICRIIILWIIDRHAEDVTVHIFDFCLPSYSSPVRCLLCCIVCFIAHIKLKTQSNKRGFPCCEGDLCFLFCLSHVLVPHTACSSPSSEIRLVITSYRRKTSSSYLLIVFLLSSSSLMTS
jgi:hypothetical protein